MSLAVLGLSLIVLSCFGNLTNQTGEEHGDLWLTMKPNNQQSRELTMTEQHHITRLVVPKVNLFINISMSMIIFYKKTR
jgi:hypothetical protein